MRKPGNFGMRKGGRMVMLIGGGINANMHGFQIDTLSKREAKKLMQVEREYGKNIMLSDAMRWAGLEEDLEDD